MSVLAESPLLLFAVSLLVQWAAAFGGRLARRGQKGDGAREQIVTVLNASLTLLALLIGFSLAMAVGRYDQRKNDEAAEANAIGTEYLRADLLPAPAAAQIQRQLVSYTRLRIDWYAQRDPAALARIDADTVRLQAALWDAMAAVARVQPTVPVSQATAGMNDVLNAQAYTQAAWWNRIPPPVWMLLLLVAVACNALLGRVESRVSVTTLLLLPVLLAVSLFLIAEIDSPRAGLIRVTPQNLAATLQSLPPRPPPAGDAR